MHIPGYTRLLGHEYPRVYKITKSWIPQGIRDCRVMNIPGYKRLPGHEVMNTPGYTRLPSHEHPRVYEITGSWISRRTQVYRVVNTLGYTRGNPRNGKGNTKRHTAEAKEKGEQWTWRMKCQHPRLCPDVSRYSLWSPSVGVEQGLQDNKQTRQFKSVKEKNSLPPSTLCISESAVVGVGGGGLVVGAPTRTKNPMSCCTIHWFANRHAQVIVFPAKFWQKKNFWCLLKQSIQC